MDQETTPTSEEANVEPIEAITDLLVGADVDDTEDTTDDTEDLDTEEAEESTEVDESEEEAPEEIEEPETWASALGVEDSNVLLDEEGNFAGVNIKVDGESSTVNMKDLIAGFQTNKHNTHSSQALSQERKTFETQRDDAITDYNKKLSDVSKLSEFMHNTLLSEFNSVNWQELRQTDPAEYAAMYQDFENRKQEIQNIYSAIDQERSTEQSNTQNNNQTAQYNYLQDELTKVQANNPEWDTNEKIQTAFKDMSTFVSETYGITPEVFNSLGDSRYVEVIKDAMAYRNGKKVTQKKIKQNLPKFQKSKNGKSNKRVSKLDKLTKIAKTQTGAGRRDAEVNAIAELLGG